MSNHFLAAPAVYQHDPEGMVMTGWMMMTLQLFHGPEGVLHKIGLSGIVNEIRRDLIAMVPLACLDVDRAAVPC